MAAFILGNTHNQIYGKLYNLSLTIKSFTNH